jgi:hypothetical protein
MEDRTGDGDEFERLRRLLEEIDPDQSASQRESGRVA